MSKTSFDRAKQALEQLLQQHDPNDVMAALTELAANLPCDPSGANYAVVNLATGAPYYDEPGKSGSIYGYDVQPYERPHTYQSLENVVEDVVEQGGVPEPENGAFEAVGLGSLKVFRLIPVDDSIVLPLLQESLAQYQAQEED